MSLAAFLPYLGAVAGAAATGVLFPTGAWYAGLSKPGFTPPNLTFPVVWTLLYLMIATAATRIAGHDGSGTALGLWSLQIVLNALWTPVVFGAHRLRAGLVILALLWLAAAATMIAFFRLDLVAGLLFLPYLAWLCVAFALNLGLIRLNPAETGDARA